MKIRSGFVANSSSSSFCIYGAQVESADIKSLAHLITEEAISEYLKKNSWNKSYNFNPEHSDFDPTCVLDVYLPPLGLTYVYGNDDDIYIGRESGAIGDDETGKQFKESTHIITKMFPNVSVDDICWHEGEINC